MKLPISEISTIYQWLGGLLIDLAFNNWKPQKGAAATHIETEHFIIKFEVKKPELSPTTQ